MFNRDISLRRLERFLFRYSDIPNAAAETTAQIVGVFIGVKPAMEGDFSATYSDAKILWRFTKILEELKLCVIFETAQSATGGKTFYIARSHKKAAELQEAFRELWCKGPSAEIHTRIGTLLGYPDSAVQYFIRAHTENGISDNHMDAARVTVFTPTAQRTKTKSLRLTKHLSTSSSQNIALKQQKSYVQIPRNVG